MLQYFYFSVKKT